MADITGPIAAGSTAGVGSGPPSAPAGWWTNPANASQYLPQDQAAKIGSLCLQGPAVGRYSVGGNYGNSVLFCKALNCQDAITINGAIGAAVFMLLPSPWKWLGLIPAGYAGMSCLLGGTL
jgi:hypothetical protein